MAKKLEYPRGVDFWKTLTANGWEGAKEYAGRERNEHSVYRMNIVSCSCYAWVTEYMWQLGNNGYFGVSWVDTLIENNPPYDRTDLEDMLGAIEKAEDNLLLIGIPFVPDYKFLGKNAANKKRRNDALRKKLKLAEMEAYWDARDEDGNLIKGCRKNGEEGK